MKSEVYLLIFLLLMVVLHFHLQSVNHYHMLDDFNMMSKTASSGLEEIKERECEEVPELADNISRHLKWKEFGTQSHIDRIELYNEVFPLVLSTVIILLFIIQLKKQKTQ